MNVKSENQFLQAVARRLVRDRTQADDLVQEAWLLVLRRGVDDIENPRPWLAGVLRNLAFRAGRSQRRRSHYEDNAPPADANGACAPDDRAVLEEAKRGVVRALAALEPAYREVVRLRYFENLNSTQIAARLGVSASTVRTRLQRALHAMRAQLETNWSGDAGSLGIGLAGLAAGLAPRDPRPLLFSNVWNGPRLGAAAAMLVAAVAWWAALTHRGAPPVAQPSFASAAAPAMVASAPPSETPARAVTTESPAVERRLLAAVVVEQQGGLEGEAHVTFRAEAAGATVEHDVPFDRTRLVDLTELTRAGWPSVLWVEARHGVDRRAVRVDVDARDRATTVVRVSLTLRAPDREDADGITREPDPAPAFEPRAPVVLGPRDARPATARSVARRRSGARAEAAPAVVAPAAPAAAAIPTLRRMVVSNDDGKGAAAVPPPIAPPTLVFPEIRDRDSDRDRERDHGVDPRKLIESDPYAAMPPEAWPGATLTGIDTGSGSIVIQIEASVDERHWDDRYWLGDDRGPFLELPDGWRRGDPVRVDGLPAGRYRLFSGGRRRGWEPRARIDVFAYERSAIVVRDGAARAAPSPIGPALRHPGEMSTDSSPWPWLSALAQLAR